MNSTRQTLEYTNESESKKIMKKKKNWGMYADHSKAEALLD